MPGNVTGYLNQQRGVVDAATAARNLAHQQNTGQVLQPRPPGGPMSFSPPSGGPTQGSTINFGGYQSPQRQYTPNPFIKAPPQGIGDALRNIPTSGTVPFPGMPSPGGGLPPRNIQPVARGNPYLLQALRGRGG